jgi:hypothetical protein
MKILQGLIGLCASRKGTAFLLVFLISAAGLFTKHLDGTNFAVVIGIIFAIFTGSHAYQQVNAPTIPPRGSL